MPHPNSGDTSAEVGGNCESTDVLQHPVEAIRKLPKDLEAAFPIPYDGSGPTVTKKRRINPTARYLTGSHMMGEVKIKDEQIMQKNKAKEERILKRNSQKKVQRSKTNISNYCEVAHINIYFCLSTITKMHMHTLVLLLADNHTIDISAVTHIPLFTIALGNDIFPLHFVSLKYFIFI